MKIGIRDLFWMIALCAIAAAWIRDRQQLKSEMLVVRSKLEIANRVNQLKVDPEKYIQNEVGAIMPNRIESLGNIAPPIKGGVRLEPADSVITEEDNRRRKQR